MTRAARKAVLQGWRRKQVCTAAPPRDQMTATRDIDTLHMILKQKQKTEEVTMVLESL